jgi:hypothetical protein
MTFRKKPAGEAAAVGAAEARAGRR